MASFDIDAGPFEFAVDTGQIMVSPQFVQGESIRAVSCRADLPCPPLGAGLGAARCVSGTCQPDPVRLDLALAAVIDLDSYSTDLGAVGNVISLIELRQLHYEATLNALRGPVGPTEIFWGPETATGPGSDGVHLLGRVPVVQVGGASPLQGDITLERAGSAALARHLRQDAHRFRLFARTSVGLVPGGPVPSGSVHIALQARIHVEGEILHCEVPSIDGGSPCR